ncbi:unnamed protein product [Amoebophrya sp. A120]|nr:unnamed protein product [Amoebophrya sp. A120]|eukprot:GSA120T00015146001.1
MTRGLATSVLRRTTAAAALAGTAGGYIHGVGERKPKLGTTASQMTGQKTKQGHDNSYVKSEKAIANANLARLGNLQYGKRKAADEARPSIPLPSLVVLSRVLVGGKDKLHPGEHELIENYLPDLQKLAEKKAPPGGSNLDADFAFAYVLAPDTALAFSQLPKRDALRPYLVWMHGLWCVPGKNSQTTMIRLGQDLCRGAASPLSSVALAECFQRKDFLFEL